MATFRVGASLSGRYQRPGALTLGEDGWLAVELPATGAGTLAATLGALTAASAGTLGPAPVTTRSALLTSLVAYWPLDEASGDALDAHGANTLTDTNTVGSASGKIGNARDFENGSTEYFTVGNNASLQTGDIDFTFAAWVKFESLGAYAILGKHRSTSSEYTLDFETTVFSFSVFSTIGSGGGTSVQVTPPSVTVGTWYFVVAWHDATANTINLQVDNGTISSNAHSGGVYLGTGDFQIGAFTATGPATETWDGLIDEVGFWKRILTPTERTALYNGGLGLAYPLIPALALAPVTLAAVGTVAGAAVLAAAATVTVTATGVLTPGVVLAAAPSATATAAGSVLTALRLVGAGTGVATSTGALTIAPAGLAGSPTATALVAGGLTTVVSVRGAATATATATGGLTTALTLAGGGVATATASGALTTISASNLGATLPTHTARETVVRITESRVTRTAARSAPRRTVELV